MSSQRPVQIIIRIQGIEEDLDIAEAFAERPKDVRDAILDAVRLIKPPKNDMNLLAIESSFWYRLENLEEKWGEPKILRSVFDACRQGSLEDTTEGRFYDLGGAAGVIALAVATVRHKNTLHRLIDALPIEELNQLIYHVNKIPKGAVIHELAARYMRLAPGPVSNPPPQLARPRFHGTNKGSATTTQPSDPLPPRLSKKRRFRPETLDQLQHTHLPPINTIGLPARQQSQTLPPLGRLPIQPLYSIGQHQPSQQQDRCYNTGLDLPQRPQTISQDTVSVSWHSPSKQRDQCHNTALDLPQRPQTIGQDAVSVSSENIQGPASNVYIQSNTDPQPPTVSQEALMAFADSQPEPSYGNSEFGLYLRDRLMNFDFDESQFAWDFAGYSQDRPLNLDFGFVGY
ncbi:hypothetical protein O988_03380 [Pseudogymnoascus sp. VKM F-3808]|nr:hypothetical protein O988_03380 [Pseudogymnoascus sp. VKM F-3808]